MIAGKCLHFLWGVESVLQVSVTALVKTLVTRAQRSPWLGTFCTRFNVAGGIRYVPT